MWNKLFEILFKPQCDLQESRSLILVINGNMY